jgi:DNA transposition AAA+ family ATPase
MNEAPRAAAVSPSPFLVTKEYRRFAEFCHACRRDRYIGLCYGPPGVGKTLSARYYAQWDRVETVRPRWYHADRVVPAEIAHCRTVFYTPPVANTPRGIAQTVRDLRFQLSALVEDALHNTSPPEVENDTEAWERPDCTELLIVDEADRLKMAGLEQLRDLYDQGSFGMILMGMPGLEKRLARYAQLYSRVGFAHAFRPLSTDEMAFILAHHWATWGLTLDPQDFTDTEAVAAIARITGGNFRLLHRLFAQIGRILTINELRTITKEVVEAARECLVIGTT